MRALEAIETHVMVTVRRLFCYTVIREGLGHVGHSGTCRHADGVSNSQRLSPSYSVDQMHQIFDFSYLVKLPQPCLLQIFKLETEKKTKS